MRLFLGIELPPELKKVLSGTLEKIKPSEKGWENPHDYHLTLLFIGETSRAEEIIQRMGKIRFAPFKLSTTGLKFFPRRILYLGFAPSPELFQLKDLIEKEFPEWVHPQAKPFLPHLTVKRFQRYEFDELTKRIHENKLESQTFEVTKLALFKSEKNEANQKYHVIYEENLLPASSSLE